MRLPTLLLAASSLVGAVFVDEVGDIDYHHELIGVPQVETTFFHKPRKDDKASLLYSLSDVGVVGAVNPSNGAVVWRQFLTGNITNGGGHLRAAEGEDWVVSAYGNTVQAWNAMSGRSVWWTDFTGDIRDLEVMELTENGRKDVLALFEEEDGSSTLRRLNGKDGSVVFEFHDTSKTVPLQVSNNIEKIFVVSLYGSANSYGVRVSVHDTVDGRRVDDISLGSKGDVQTKEDLLLVGANSASPIIAWTDSAHSKLKVNVLGTKTKQEFPLPADTLEVAIHAPHHLQSEPHFLVHSRTKAGNKGEVYHVNIKNNAITRDHELPLLPGLGAFSTSSEGANVWFTRITEEEVILTSSSSHAILGRWPYKAGTESVSAIHAVSEVIKKAGDNFAVRCAAVTTSDDWLLVRNGEQAWSRPEGLTGGVAAAFAEIPESEDLAKTLEAEAHSSILSAYIHRVTRHIDDLAYLPDYLASIPQRLVSSITGAEVSKTEGLSRDAFGFNKLVVLATRRGKLFGLDVGKHGKVIWKLDAFKIPRGSSWDVKGIFVEDAKSHVTVRGFHGEYVVAKTDTGKMVDVMPEGSWAQTQAAAIVDSPSGPWLAPVGIGGAIGDIPAAWAPKQTVVVRGTNGELKGLTYINEDGTAKEQVAWEFTPPAGYEIVNIATRPVHDPIASIGRVLGDRKVRYKYLNPNTIVVSTVNAAKSTLSVSLLDSVSGEVLHSTSYEGVDTDKNVECTLSENWFVCTFFGEYALKDDAGQPQSGQSLKGYQIVVSDLYESDYANDRGPLGDAANFSSTDPVETPTGAPLPSVISQAWILSAPLAALAVTQTRQGITSRHVLGYLPQSHAIVGLPRQLLEPRRPVGRDPTPAEMEAEGLVRYHPALEIDPRQVITHQRDVIGIQKIITSPTIVESTSLIFSFGVDVFGTRATPSFAFDILGKGFNKISLISTVLALTVGVAVLGPIVRKKQTNMRWA
ncbi:ER membrane protein complex subunit 1 [Colletotrichum sp. SAR 10_86]|nr:ER membrane protein complex subunit 1 [Colletotrichum sp. SAR 10_75]KAI8210773.1 ER membrane protein complex subunit 1 [Colletotrichum sp. SAR 10_76]KAI8234567.1 ER membrane protein complex subunit 1 [Colletotrichum sp. SAR 10_86]KAJ5003807.1 ER membrane protein complex subunit 1 [Colletotrichum sp. SAR 10_66]